MSITQVERQWLVAKSSNKSPYQANTGIVGDTIISIEMDNSSSSYNLHMHNIETNTDVAYALPCSYPTTNLLTINANEFVFCSADAAGLTKININTGIINTYGSYTNNLISKLGNKIYCRDVGLNLDTSTTFNTNSAFPVFSMPTVCNNRLFKLMYADDTKIIEIDPDDLSVLNTFNTPENAKFFSEPAIRDGVLWFQGASNNCLVGFDTSTNSFKITRGTSGYLAQVNSWTLYENNNYLVSMENANTLVIIDPDSGRWKKETLSPSRTYRGRILNHGSKLLIPSSLPGTWD